MNLDKAEGIPGWMSTSELAWLAERASESSLIIEIGSWYGRSCRGMADNSDALIYAVDVWDSSYYTPFVREFVKGWIGDKPQEFLWETFNSNLFEHIESHRVIPVRETSVNAAKQFTDGTADLVFIDADHEYESVRDDIAAWRSKVTAGGILSGHDWHLEGVQKAVREAIGEPQNPAGSIWWKRV